MLQIVTKMYFRSGVPLNTQLHRQVLYTNRSFLTTEVAELPVGELAPSSAKYDVAAVTASVVEYLEAERPDGESEILITTSGIDLIDDLADVLSFGLNSIFSRDRDLVQRLVSSSDERSHRSRPAKLFRRTFDPALTLLEPELDEFREFMSQLLALERRSYERAMRAIRRILRATRRAVDDPTIAYADLVAALESLSSGEDAPEARWDQTDGRKRKLIDAALEDADPALSEAVRIAVMEADRLGATNRFLQFVLRHTSPEFFRAEATEAIRPVRRPDLERALKSAYSVRSRNVHSLWDLPPEAWVLGDAADTVSPGDLGLMLSLEGLTRLARHVVRSYVATAPTGIDRNFDWRGSLPGIVKMQMAPQYWIHAARGFRPETAATYFGGFLENLLAVRSGEEPGVSPMDSVLARIEELAPETADSPAKTSMVAIYVLWHGVTAPELHRPRAEQFLAKHRRHLIQPSMEAFSVGALSGAMPDWSVEQWIDLAERRCAERRREKEPSLPPKLDAAMQAWTAAQLIEAHRRDEALSFAAKAVEELPGDKQLIEWEVGLAADEDVSLDVSRLLGDPSASQ
jgi:hypothetical protein